jgi:hypothetical protein
MRHGGLRHVEVAVEVGLERAVELLLGQILEARDVKLEGGIVDQNVEAAQFLHCPLDGIEAEGALGDIACDHQAASPVGLDGAARDLGVLGLVEMHDGDIGALAREQHRHGAADARVAAGDQRDLVEQLERTLVVRGFVHRRGIKPRFLAGLALVLLGQWRRRVGPRARLHRLFGLLRRPASVSLRAPALQLAVPLGGALRPARSRSDARHRVLRC